MTAISASLVKDLREKTGAGMMDCKKALAETNGDFEAAVDWLRKKGIAAAAKKTARVAAEGLVAIASAGKTGAVVEVNAETDFVARNEQFQRYASTVATLALTQGESLESLKNAAYPGTGRTVAEELTNLIATVGENMSLRRVQTLAVPQGLVATYVHNAVVANLGKIGVLIALESSAPADVLETLGKKLAMHVAAANPMALTIEGVNPEAINRERDVLAEQARASGKPEEIIAKMVEGRLRKFYEEVVLLEQVFVMDGETRIKDVIAQAAKACGAPIALKAYSRFMLGEGIEKEVKDFAAEVQQQLAS